ncbi:phage replisome organizer N-terminal domain-containing protein [uncultured Clostridium sp.]|jgi:predicted phage replisome organizer|uniref:phage replisome organizer N-terminal domain-containing protein n=1 Tax=uncultured Clostridium sp. TaxID=59620 RepID=UPI0026240479|nr:phage replisome organizer N-terminal domain-containing protein [uncultured Clostridium sp.]
MSDNKKYYYLKLKDDFFDSPEIKVLESMTNGYKYSNLLLKLYLKALKFNGALRLNEFIPYSIEMVAAITGMDIDTVKVAFELFKQLKLIEVLDDGTIYMLEIQNFIGTSSSEADRKRKYRIEIDAKKNKEILVGQMSGQMADKNPPEIEIEIEKEIEIEIEIENRDKSIEGEIENSKTIPDNLQQVADAWNSLNITKIKSIKSTRLKLLNSRIKEYGVDVVIEGINSIAKSSFLRGQNDRSWIISFDWFIKPNNFQKVLDGNYTDKEAKGNGSSNRQNNQGQAEFKGTDRSSEVKLSDEERAKLESELM